MLTSKSCRNLLKETRGYRLYDYPLRYPSTISFATNVEKQGGIHIYYNPQFEEVGFSMNYWKKTGDASADLITKHIVFNEKLDCFVTKKDVYVSLSFLHKGTLYSIGRFKDMDLPFSQKKYIWAINNEATGANSVGSYLGHQGQDFILSFVNNEDVGSIKIFDKLVASYDGTSSSGVFSNLAFETNYHTITLTDPQNYIRSVIGKDIWPVVTSASTGRLQGNYLKVTITSETTTNEINLWSFITHYRKILV